MVVLLVALLVVGLPILSWAQGKGWEQEWNEMVAAAKREGKVVLMGSADPVLRKELPTRFKARFGIAVEYLGGRGSDNSVKLRMERQAGHYTIDAVMAGPGTMAEYYNEKIIDPLRPVLVLPDVVDGSKWKKGKLWFADPEQRYVLRLYYYIDGGHLSVNTQHTKPEDFKSVKELLEPKWKGKIAVYDPTVSGTGNNDATRFYLLLGEEFVRQIYVDQKPGISRDKRQLADWLARGTYAVSVSAETEFIMEMKKQGLPVDVLGPPDAPGTISSGNGQLALINKAPHPNAARVFVNWAASKEGVELLGRARQKPTTRNDIDESYAVPWEVPRADLNYFDGYDWEFNAKREKVRQWMKDLLKR